MSIVRFKNSLLAAPAAMLGLLPIEAQAASFEIVEATIEDVRDAFETGTLTSTELTQMYLERIEEFDPQLNSVPIINPDALERAAELDRLYEQGTILGPLHGIPVVVKNSYNVEGLTTTNGVEAFETFTAQEDAFAVAQLQQAGAIILGKATMSTWAFSYDGISEAYGTVLNPYAPNRTPGGSSSGSAVAVASNLAMFSMGGETGGSIRVPSTHNALVGLKPSAGLVSVDGTWPLVTERDVIGPMAKSVSDVAIAMDALVAPDPDNIWNPYIPPIAEIRPDSYTDFLDDTALEGQVLGLPTHYIGEGDPDEGQDFPLQPEVAEAFEQAKDILEAQGATLVEVDIPAHVTWFSEEPIEGYPGYPESNERSNLSRAFYYEQLIQGYDDEEIRSFVDLLDIYSEDYEFYDYVELVAEPLLEGTARPWEELPEVDRALSALAELRTLQYENFMAAEGIDAFVFPTLNYLAPPQDENVASGVYSRFGSLPARFEANILGLPAIAVPMGYSENGIPTSLEFMGNIYGEAELIGYAHDFEEASSFRRPPSLPIPEPASTTALLVLGFLPFLPRRRRELTETNGKK
ncbi:MAG: amidase [Cyanophyceae cyanobacterium]